MAKHERYTPIEEVIDIHPLDEIGNDINEILQLDHHIMTTDAGTTYMRTIDVGDVAFFFARFDGHRRRTFTVGIDQIKDDKITPLVDYRWNIYAPEEAGLDDDELRKLKDITRIIGY